MREPHSLQNTSTDPQDRPFVGRYDECERLSARLLDVKDGRRLSIAVVGQPGVGKTRLVQECLSRSLLNDATIWSVRCEDQNGSEPLGPILQLLRQIFALDRTMQSGEVVSIVEAQLVSLGLEPHIHLSALIGVLRPELLVEDRRAAHISDVVRSVAALLGALAIERTQFIWIDDLQWADQGSWQILDAIC